MLYSRDLSLQLTSLRDGFKSKEEHFSFGERIIFKGDLDINSRKKEHFQAKKGLEAYG